MLFIASPSASIRSELFFPGNIGELPSRSVGPDPEMNITTGICFALSFGRRSVLCSDVSTGTTSRTGGDEEGCCPKAAEVTRRAAKVARMCRLSLHLSSRSHDFRQGAIPDNERRLRA